MPIEHGVHSANGREVDVAVTAADLLADLWRSPARVLLAQPHDQLLDLEGQAIGVPIRTTRPIGQSFQTTILVAGEDLVAALAGDIELPAQHRHLFPLEQSSHKAQPFVHFVTLPPRHLRPPQMPEVLPMCPE